MTPDTIWTHITELVAEVLAERGEECGALTESALLNATLGISSVEAIHLMIMLEDRLGTALSFQDLAVRDGEYVDDLSLGDLLRFACRTVGAGERASASLTPSVR